MGRATLRCGVIVAALAAGAAGTPVSASDLTYFTTVTNTDVATYAIGNMRGVGNASLSVTGLSGTVTGAFLYWHGPTNSSDPLANAAVSFAGNGITGTNIGFSDDNAWAYQNSQAYRADVTSLVAGNGVYSLANFTKTDVEVNGAELIVFYSDGVAANNRDVVLFNGNDSNLENTYDADGWNATLNGVNYAGGGALMTLGVSDGQDFGAGDDGTLAFNGVTIGNGHDFNGVNSQYGPGTAPVLPVGRGNGSLWDVNSYNVTSLITTGSNKLSLVPTNDALSLITAMFRLPVGAAPPPPLSSVPEPASWAMFIGGFGLIGSALRRQRTAKIRLA